MYRKSGSCFTALYLKQCTVSLQRYYANTFDPKVKLTVFVSLTRCGIPRVIPAVLRSHIRRRDCHGDMLVKLYLSWFGLANAMLVAPKVTRSTFASIVTPHPDIERVREVLEEIKTSFRDLQPLYLPHLRAIPLVKGITWEPTWKSTPILDSFLRTEFNYSVSKDVDECCKRYSKFHNIFVNLKHEIAAFIYKVNKVHSFVDGFFSPGIMWYPRVLYPMDYRMNTRFANWDLDYFERCVGPYYASLLPAYKRLPIAAGRLSQVISGGGKRRLFAICNYVQQRLLFPVHKWAMQVLSCIPADGTFDQERPLRILRQKEPKKFYSFDLKSATDRWPLSVIYTLQECIWGPTLASSIVNSSLGLNTFLVRKPLTKKMYEVAFLTGQALGLYGSWSLFALSHHYIVWLAARRVRPKDSRPFWNYALLGDDIVIADEEVAMEYRRILEQLNVMISLPKSLISDNGTMEFAKLYWTKSMQIDLSPISLRALWNTRSTVGICALAEKYKVTKPSVLFRLAGAGYRVRARLHTTQSKRWARLRAVSSKPLRSGAMPLEWWIGRGNPLNPYLRARLILFLLKEVKPKEIRFFPDAMVFDGEREILERTVLSGWMKQWLKWVSWYHTKALDPEVSIDQLLDAPMCSTSWKRSNFDPNRFKFGLIWKLYDMAAGWTISTVPSNLLDPNTKIQHSRWILGGITGTDFLMEPVD